MHQQSRIMEFSHDPIDLSGSFRRVISFSALLTDESIYVPYGKHFFLYLHKELMLPLYKLTFTETTPIRDY